MTKEHFTRRIQNDKTIFNHATAAIEIAPDREACTTEFTIHKYRWGQPAGTTVIMNYDRGRFTSLGDNSDARLVEPSEVLDRLKTGPTDPWSDE